MKKPKKKKFYTKKYLDGEKFLSGPTLVRTIFRKLERELWHREVPCKKVQKVFFPKYTVFAPIFSKSISRLLPYQIGRGQVRDQPICFLHPKIY